MKTPRKPFAPIAPSVIAKAKRLFEAGEKAAAIAAALDMSAATVTRYAKNDGWRDPAAKPKSVAPKKIRRAVRRSPAAAALKTPAPAISQPAPAPDIAPGERRATLVERIWKVAELQVAEIERRMADSGEDIAGIERGARGLAVVSRTLADLDRLDAQINPTAPDNADDEDGDDDIDAYRAQLARLLEGFRRERTDAGADSANHAETADAPDRDELGVPRPE